MTASYDDTVAALYQSPHDKFVGERKRLSTELKAGGDKAGAARLAKLPRPSISAWAVNQLWWHERGSFDQLLTAAELLRRGERTAASRHREALGRLRARAATLLGAAGHAATEGTLRRVATTLSALAAAGGFDPDPPGALSADRDPPGFDAARSGFALPDLAEKTQPERAAMPDVKPAGVKHEANGAKLSAEAGPAGVQVEKESARQRLEAERARAEAEEKRQQLEAERVRAEVERKRRRLEEERARAQAERQRLQAALRTAQGQVEARTREVERLRQQLTLAEQELALARETVEKLELRLATTASEMSGSARDGDEEALG